MELREQKMTVIRQFLAREFVYYAINSASKLNGEQVLRIASADGKTSYKVQISEALLTDDTPSPDLLGRLLTQRDIASKIKEEGTGLFMLRHEDLV